jgi:hypothetical protein
LALTSRTASSARLIFDSELAAARERGEQPAVLCRTIILTAFQNSAMKALADQPDLLSMSPVEQQRAFLEAFAVE